MSFPYGAGTTCIDYLNKGIPVLFNQQVIDTICLTDNSNFVWSSLDELSFIINNAKPAELKQISDNNISHFLKNYKMEIFKLKMDEVLSTKVEEINNSKTDSRVTIEECTLLYIFKTISIKGLIRLFYNITQRSMFSERSL